MYKVTFDCAECKQAITYERDSDTGGAGYAHAEDGKICYACCAIRDKRDMLANGKHVLYLVKRDGANVVTNWCGTLSFDVKATRESRAVVFGRRYTERVDAWFTGPDNKLWHGINQGDNQLLRCKRVKSDSRYYRRAS